MSAAPQVKPVDHIALLTAAWEQHLRSLRKGGTYERTHVWASGRRSCIRRMALDLLHPEDEPPWPVESLERFQRGEEREASVVARLMQLGPRCEIPFDVIEQQRRFEVRDRDGILLITGKVDGRLSFVDGSRPIFDVKSGDTVRAAQTLEDLDRSPWTRHHVDQLLAYLLSEGEAWGFLILDRPGLPAFIRVNLLDHLERAESFLRDARAAVDARFGGPLPAPISDISECRRCPHAGKSCDVPISWGPGAQVIDDYALLDACRVREQHAAAAKTYERADKALKDALRGVELAIIGGEYLAEGTWQRRTVSEIPDDIKKQFSRVDEKGSFRLSLTKLEAK